MKLAGVGFKTGYIAHTCVLEFFAKGLCDNQKSLQLQKALCR